MIKTLTKLIIVAAIGFAAFTWWNADDKVIIRKTESLIGFFIKSSGDVDFRHIA